MGSAESKSKRRREAFTIDVGYLTNCEFPQYYPVQLARADDFFWNYTFLCTPFSFRTLCESQSLNLKGEEGFRNFGKLLCELVEQCRSDPDCYQAKLLMYEREGICSLVFTETFSRERVDQARARLARLLNVIQVHAPTLLLSISSTQKQSTKAQRWFESTRVALNVVCDRSEPPSPSIPAAARLFDKTDWHNKQVIFAMPLLLADPVPDQLPPRLEFRILAFTPTRSASEPKTSAVEPRFRLAIAAQGDPLFLMATEDIDRERWRVLVRDHGGLPAFGFLPDEGLGGFVGVISACIRESHSKGRYSIQAQATSEDATGTGFGSAHCPRRGLRLTITEHSKYRTCAFLSFHLTEVGDDLTKAHLAESIAQLQTELECTTQRLNEHLDVVKAKRPALLLHLAKLSGETASSSASGSLVKGAVYRWFDTDAESSESAEAKRIQAAREEYGPASRLSSSQHSSEADLAVVAPEAEGSRASLLVSTEALAPYSPGSSTPTNAENRSRPGTPVRRLVAMFSRGSAEERKRSAEIDKQLRDEAKSTGDTRRILLLGTSESGKSTVLKQMKLISNGHLNDYETSEWRRVLQGNIVRCVCELLHGMKSIGLALENPAESSPHADLLLALPESTYRKPPPTLPDEWVAAVVALAKDPALQVAFDRRHDLFEHITRLMSPACEITNDDIIHARQETLACSETRLQMHGLNYKVYDVPGSRSERHAWIPFFDDANAILFVVSTSSYDQVLAEDPTTNRLLESMMVFDSVVNNTLLEKVAIILFLNKIDLLKTKFDPAAFAAHFPDFAPAPPKEDRIEHVLKFLYVFAGLGSVKLEAHHEAKKFYYLNRKRERKLYVHNTCATDTKQVRVLLATINKIVIKLNLEMTQLA
ncbi:guanine nucleotide-binding protein subunit alpha [Blastocladiella emersonii ATCC 22665]|nr:guanine nucleotide-binding protein subunit alpha [Blastocladiella emersonii ATCC 22665]